MSRSSSLTDLSMASNSSFMTDNNTPEKFTHAKSLSDISVDSQTLADTDPKTF